jgi:hypothetical protein
MMSASVRFGEKDMDQGMPQEELCGETSTPEEIPQRSSSPTLVFIPGPGYFGIKSSSSHDGKNSRERIYNLLSQEHSNPPLVFSFDFFQSLQQVGLKTGSSIDLTDPGESGFRFCQTRGKGVDMMCVVDYISTVDEMKDQMEWTDR